MTLKARHTDFRFHNKSRKFVITPTTKIEILVTMIDSTTRELSLSVEGGIDNQSLSRCSEGKIHIYHKPINDNREIKQQTQQFSQHQ